MDATIAVVREVLILSHNNLQFQGAMMFSLPLVLFYLIIIFCQSISSVTEGNKVFLRDLASVFITLAWYFCEIDFNSTPAIMNIEWGNSSNITAMVNSIMFDPSEKAACPASIIIMHKTA